MREDSFIFYFLFFVRAAGWVEKRGFGEHDDEKRCACGGRWRCALLCSLILNYVILRLIGTDAPIASRLRIQYLHPTPFFPFQFYFISLPWLMPCVDLPYIAMKYCFWWDNDILWFFGLLCLNQSIQPMG